MQRRRPMRLLLREHGIASGTETVNIHLIQEFTQLAERIVWVVPNWRMNYLQQILPPSDRLVYEPPFWPPEIRLPHIFRKAMSLALRQKALPARVVFERMREGLFDLWLKRLIQQHGITHCFCNWTFCVDVPRIGIPVGAMVMDVRWKRFPETFPHIDLDAADRQFRRWLKKSNVVFPVSETTASDLRQFYPWHDGKTRVVPHGAQIDDEGGAGPASTEVESNGRCVFFCPAAACAHKNHITLFRACAELFGKGFDFDVVLTGFKTEHFDRNRSNGEYVCNGEAAVESARTYLDEQANLFRGRIKPLGYVDRARVNALYKSAAAVIIPSLFEGFGLPLIEGLQSGATIICSDIPAHREQLTRYNCADQVALIPPRDAKALAHEMERILFKGTAQRRRPAALRQWTWRDAAEVYLDSLASITPAHDGLNNGSRISA